MAKAGEVLSMLCAGLEYAISGDKYEDINWFGKEPAITKKQYEDGFAQFDAWQAKQEADRAVAREALLTRLGITAEEALLLLA
jgi:hypothetical protein